MQLVGNSIYLRPMTIEDTNDIVRWRNKDYVRKNFLYQELFTPETHLNWIKTKVDTGEVVQFVIVEKENDRAVGSVYLRDIDQAEKTAEYGVFIGEEEALHKGYGSECARLVTDYANKEMGLKKLFLRFVDGNIAAKKSYEAAGFKETGKFEYNVSTLTGENRKVLFMERTF